MYTFFFLNLICLTVIGEREVGKKKIEKKQEDSQVI